MDILIDDHGVSDKGGVVCGGVQDMCVKGKRR
jgi:hypothetical protein